MNRQSSVEVGSSGSAACDDRSIGYELTTCECFTTLPSKP